MMRTFGSPLTGSVLTFILGRFFVAGVNTISCIDIPQIVPMIPCRIFKSFIIPELFQSGTYSDGIQIGKTVFEVL